MGRDDPDAGEGMYVLAIATEHALRTKGADQHDSRRILLIASYMLIYRVGLRDATLA